ncbi:MAG: GntR family transcriptional regulator, partial [Candidatus Scatosoma sp.]
MKKYERLYELLKKEIVAGAYRPGDKLPPKRALAEENAVSLATVETALDILRSEGYIDSKERSGCFVCYSQSEAFSPFPPVGRENAAASLFPLRETVPPTENGAAENGFLPPFPFYAYARAARAVLAENGERVLQKSPGGGVYELKTALKNYLMRSRGINVGEKQIVLGAGAEYLY